jgi:ABC-type glycerol-3-phosphate transport system substrate-binding protein
LRRCFRTRAALVALASSIFSTTTACGLDRSDSVQVAVVWTGHEYELFREIVADFEAETDIPVDVISAGDNIDGFLRASDRAGTLPDIAVLPEPGLVRAYIERDWLFPLDSALTTRYAPFWRRLGTVGDELYGAWVKASYKSLLWYQSSDLDQAAVPRDWERFQDLVGELASAAEGPAPLAIGAANAWVLTDWLENLLLAREGTPPNLYRDLAAGEPLWCSVGVRRAFEDLAGIWGIEGAFPGGGHRARLTDFDESVVQVAGADEALLLPGSDFVRGIAGGVLDQTEAAAGLRAVELPSPTGRQPQLLGGDVAVVLRDRDANHTLVEWLTRPGSFEPWIDAGGYFSPLLDEEGPYPDTASDRFAAAVREPEPGVAAFDLSNQLDGEVGDQIGPVLQRFFAEVAVTDRSLGERTLAAAIDRAAGALNEAAGGIACTDPGARA